MPDTYNYIHLYTSVYLLPSMRVCIFYFHVTEPGHVRGGLRQIMHNNIT